jgi:hypothetical protein
MIVFPPSFAGSEACLRVPHQQRAHERMMNEGGHGEERLGETARTRAILPRHVREFLP